MSFLAEAFRCHVHHFQCLTAMKITPLIGNINLEDSWNTMKSLASRIMAFQSKFDTFHSYWISIRAPVQVHGATESFLSSASVKVQIERNWCWPSFVRNLGVYISHLETRKKLEELSCWPHLIKYYNNPLISLPSSLNLKSNILVALSPHKPSSVVQDEASLGEKATGIFVCELSKEDKNVSEIYCNIFLSFFTGM